MLIFQLHLPHVIPNSTQALCALSHSEITFWKAPFPYQHVSLMPQQMTRLPSQRQICPLISPVLDDGRIFEMYFQMTSLLPAVVVIPVAIALELEAPLTEWALRMLVSIPASLRYVFNHLAVVLLVTGSCFPIHDKKTKVFLLSVDKVRNSKVLSSYTCSIATGQIVSSSGYLGYKNLPKV